MALRTTPKPTPKSLVEIWIGSPTVRFWIQAYAVSDDFLHARTLCFGVPNLVAVIPTLRDKIIVYIFVETSRGTCDATPRVNLEPLYSPCIGRLESFIHIRGSGCQNRRWRTF